jgi:predicted TIM-barrel fold metal-dependent hydrolase
MCKNVPITVSRRNLWLATDMYVFARPVGSEGVSAVSGSMKERMFFRSAYPIVTLKDAVDKWKSNGIYQDRMPALLGENAARFLNLNLS